MNSRLLCIWSACRFRQNLRHQAAEEGEPPWLGAADSVHPWAWRGGRPTDDQNFGKQSLVSQALEVAQLWRLPQGRCISRRQSYNGREKWKRKPSGAGSAVSTHVGQSGSPTCRSSSLARSPARPSTASESGQARA